MRVDTHICKEPSIAASGDYIRNRRTRQSFNGVVGRATVGLAFERRAN
jgi:hypothetical protein